MSGKRVMIDLRRSLLALMFVAAAAATALAQDIPIAAAPIARITKPRGQVNSRGSKAAATGRAHQEQNGPGVLSLLPADAVTEHSIDTPSRQARLYGDRRHVLAVRSIGRTLGRDFLYRLRREDREPRRGAAGDLRLQRRAGRGIRVPQSRSGRSAHRRIRHGRPRRLRTSASSTIPIPGSPSPIWC